MFPIESLEEARRAVATACRSVAQNIDSLNLTKKQKSDVIDAIFTCENKINFANEVVKSRSKGD